MEIKQYGKLDTRLVDWNNKMYNAHATPYTGLAGLIERKRVQAVLNLAQINKSDSVLEIGCESGKLLKSIKNAKLIVGADISTSALHDASKLLENSTQCVELIQLDAQQDLPFSKGQFDVIICSEMIEHVDNPRAVIENIYKISTPQTRIVISVPLEGPKLFIKKLLHSLGLFKLLFSNIEENKSEWHLQMFSKKYLSDICGNLFEKKKSKITYGVHYITRLSKNSNQ